MEMAGERKKGVHNIENMTDTSARIPLRTFSAPDTETMAQQLNERHQKSGSDQDTKDLVDTYYNPVEKKEKVKPDVNHNSGMSSQQGIKRLIENNHVGLAKVIESTLSRLESTQESIGIIEIATSYCERVVREASEEELAVSDPNEVDLVDYTPMLQALEDALGSPILATYLKDVAEIHPIDPLFDVAIEDAVAFMFQHWVETLEVFGGHKSLDKVPDWFVEKYSKRCTDKSEDTVNLLNEIALAKQGKTKIFSLDIETIGSANNPFPTPIADRVINIGAAYRVVNGVSHPYQVEDFRTSKLTTDQMQQIDMNAAQQIVAKDINSQREGICIGYKDTTIPTRHVAEKIKQPVQKCLKPIEDALSIQSLATSSTYSSSSFSSFPEQESWPTEMRLYDARTDVSKFMADAYVEEYKGKSQEPVSTPLPLWQFRQELPMPMVVILRQLASELEFKYPHPKEMPITDVAERTQLITHMHENVPSLNWWLRIRDGENVDWSSVRSGLYNIFLDFANVLWVYESDAILEKTPHNFVEKYGSYVEPDSEASELVTLYYHKLAHVGSSIPLCEDVIHARANRLQVPREVLTGSDILPISHQKNLSVVHSPWHRRRLLATIFSEAKLVRHFESSQWKGENLKHLFTTWTNIFKFYKEAGMLRKVPDWFVRNYRMRLDTSNVEEVFLMNEHDLVCEEGGEDIQDEDRSVRESVGRDVVNLFSTSNSQQAMLGQVERRLGALGLGKALCGIRC